MNCINNQTIYEKGETILNGCSIYDLRKKYSYDPETGIIRNKYGKVITAENGGAKLDHGSAVVLAVRAA